MNVLLLLYEPDSLFHCCSYMIFGSTLKMNQKLHLHWSQRGRKFFRSWSIVHLKSWRILISENSMNGRSPSNPLQNSHSITKVSIYILHINPQKILSPFGFLLCEWASLEWGYTAQLNNRFLCHSKKCITLNSLYSTEYCKSVCENGKSRNQFSFSYNCIFSEKKTFVVLCCHSIPAEV